MCQEDDLCEIKDFLKYGSFFFLVQLQGLCTFAQMQSQKHMLFLNESFCFPLQIHTVPSTLYAHWLLFYEHTHTETQIRGAREEHTFNTW